MANQQLLEDAGKLGLARYREPLAALIQAKDDYIAEIDAKGKRYLGVMERLFSASPSQLNCHLDAVTIGRAEDLTSAQREELTGLLHELDPWRKGPFNLFGIEIDSEWVSALKWNRVRQHIAPLTDRKVLDIGCSNGYYLYRMTAHRPQLLLGVEPYLTFYFQHLLLQHFAAVPNLYCLPVTFEELPVLDSYFDTVFSMGVLYHRRSPLDALMEMQRILRRGGELVLETLIIEGEGDLSLCPQKRYAKMNNVFFLPTVSCLTNWLNRSGFTNVRCIDVTPTTSAEQRKTEWIQTESLNDFLDPADPSRTVEGYPAPLRAIFVAQKK
ncbi:MAG: tRNA 5-methoxyuridine(34)/uridine 5-oxyacetic acid(34) synthase CmoB [Desulfuromonas sp.]|nr:MAG: tRNA 5-methoxyuridine(34)/uridine 5-oxyacetic acid(34) synthase CmoB [Desulfuromonas sp.]